MKIFPVGKLLTIMASVDYQYSLQGVECQKYKMAQGCKWIISILLTLGFVILMPEGCANFIKF